MIQSTEARPDLLLAYDYNDLLHMWVAAEETGARLAVHPTRGPGAHAAYDAYGRAAAPGGYHMASRYAALMVQQGGYIVTMDIEGARDGRQSPWRDFYRTLGERRIEEAQRIETGQRSRVSRMILLIGQSVI